MQIEKHHLDMLIRPHPPLRDNGKIHLQAELSSDNGETRTLWYRVPETMEDRITSHADPFVVGPLFLAMRLGEPVHVEGTVSPSLLRNLDRYMAAWSHWMPDKYKRVEITALEEKEPPKPSTDGVVMAFSGGIDSSYTAWKQANRKAGRQQVELAAAIFVLGFDIPLEYEHSDYASYFERARIMTDSIGIELIPVSTNFRELGDWWEYAYVAGVASVMHLFKSFHAGGMLAGDSGQYHLDTRAIHFGTSPFFDGWLGSYDFPIHHDGADKSRIEKIKAISEWPEAMQNLRICYSSEEKDKNCCRCQKCIGSMLLFKVAGLDIPECFPLPLSDDVLRNIRYFDIPQRLSTQRIVKAARDRGINNPWVDALEDSLKPPSPEGKDENHTPISETVGNGRNAGWTILRKFLRRRIPF